MFLFSSFSFARVRLQYSTTTLNSASLHHQTSQTTPVDLYSSFYGDFRGKGISGFSILHFFLKIFTHFKNQNFHFKIKIKRRRLRLVVVVVVVVIGVQRERRNTSRPLLELLQWLPGQGHIRVLYNTCTS